MLSRTTSGGVKCGCAGGSWRGAWEAIQSDWPLVCANDVVIDRIDAMRRAPEGERRWYVVELRERVGE
jgi:hypothetical protein